MIVWCFHSFSDIIVVSFPLIPLILSVLVRDMKSGKKRKRQKEMPRSKRNVAYIKYGYTEGKVSLPITHFK